MLQTLTFVALAYTSQATLYAIREPGLTFRLPPSRLLLASSTADIVITTAIAGFGLLTATLPPALLAATFGAAIVFGLALDIIKLPFFAGLQLA